MFFCLFFTGPFNIYKSKPTKKSIQANCKRNKISHLGWRTILGQFIKATAILHEEILDIEPCCSANSRKKNDNHSIETNSRKRKLSEIFCHSCFFSQHCPRLDIVFQVATKLYPWRGQENTYI